MAQHKPLVLIGGQPQQMPSGDTLAATSMEVDVIAAINGNAGALTVGTPVYVSAAGTVDKASAGAVGTTRVLGLVKAPSIATTATGLIQTDGTLTALTTDWDVIAGTSGGLTPGAMYFLSATAGEITATPPASAGQYVMSLGLALSSTELEIDTDRSGVLLS